MFSENKQNNKKNKQSLLQKMFGQEKQEINLAV